MHDHAVGKFIGGIFRQEVVGANALHHRAIEHTRQRRVQQDAQVRKRGVLADFRGQRIAIHFRHFDIGHQHRVVARDIDTGRGKRFEVAQRLQTIRELHHLQTKRGAAALDLLARHRRVVGNQDAQPRESRTCRRLHCFRRHRVRLRRDFDEDLLDVQHFDHAAIDLGDRREVAVGARAVGRQVHVFPLHVDDAIHRLHQKPLRRGVVLGDDHEAVAIVRQLPYPRRAGEVQDRHGDPTHRRDAPHIRVAAGHHRQPRTTQHFAHLEHVDAENLRPREAKQQQFEPILADHARAAVDALEELRHRIPAVAAASRQVAHLTCGRDLLYSCANPARAHDAR